MCNLFWLHRTHHVSFAECRALTGDIWGGAQGIETVRRDNCLLVKDVITTSLEMMLIDKDVDGAVAYVKSTISNLLMNRIDLSLLVISKVRRGWAQDMQCVTGDV